MSERRLIAVYPGSFDPLTNGHLDLIERGSRIVDELIVAILNNTSKHPLFSVEERVAMVTESCSRFGNVKANTFEGLLVDYALKAGANIILRGIRAISDYESELQMALLNRRMRPDLETVFLMAREEFSFISSRMIKEIIMLGGDVAQFVPKAVVARFQAKGSGKK
jgi:pantetheine-phosphate adenylyltransferase